MKQILLLLFFLLSTMQVYSQDETIASRKNSFNLDIGYVQNNMKDRHFSPFNNIGNGSSIGIGYKHQESNARNIFQIEILGGLSSMESTAVDFIQSDLYLLNLQGSYLWNVIEKEKLFLHIGLQTRGELFVPLFESGSALALSILSEYALDFKSQLLYKIDHKTSIISTIAIPTVSFMGRPPYGTLNEEISEAPIKYALTKMRYASPLKLQRFRYMLGIKRIISSRWNINLHYIWDYKRVGGDYPAIYSNQFVQLGTQYKF